MKLKLLMSTLLVLCFLVTLLTIPVKAQDIGDGKTKNAEEIALQYVSKTHNILLSRLKIANHTQITDIATGEKAEGINVLDKQGAGQVFNLVIDASGQVKRMDEYNEIVNNHYMEKYGKLSPGLYDLLQFKQLDDKIKVCIWLKGDPTSASEAVTTKYPEANLFGGKPSKNTDMNLYTKIQAEKHEAIKQAIHNIQQPAINLVQSKGVVFGIADDAPIIFAELSKNAITELSQNQEVDTVYQWRNDGVKPLDIATKTVGADSVWSSGYTGSGIKIVEIEANGISNSHPYLPVMNMDKYYNPGNLNIDEHPTEVAGVIASQHPIYKGVAPWATLYSGNTNGSYNDIISATQWAIYQGVNIILPELVFNVPGQQPSADLLDRYFDWVSRGFNKTVIVPAGNISQSGIYVCTPGLGYNILSVGNYNDNNTSGWINNSMVDSCYLNPTDCKEKPEVAAPGSDIHTTGINNVDVYGFKDAGGTSLAAPVVAGEAALLMQQNSILTAWPELTRAVIMASAFHNIEGNSRLSSQDGAGGVSAKIASEILSSGHYDFGYLNTSSFPVGSWNTHYFVANAGDRIRATLTWDSHPTYNGSDYVYPNPALSTQLNLLLYDPYGNLVDASASTYNSFQMIDFTAQVGGQYALKFQNVRMADGYEWYGLAWDARTLRTLTASTNNPAYGTVTNPGMGLATPYKTNEVINIVATPSPGYRFVNWTGYTDTIANPNSSNTTITMNTDKYVTANFDIDNYDLIISSTAGGTVTSPGIGTFLYSLTIPSVNISASPNTGYRFVNWTGSTNIITNPNSANTTTWVTVAGSYPIQANFVPDDTTPPSVTINQAAGQADPTNTYPINFTVVFSEPVPDFATGDVTLSGTAGATTAVVTGSGTTYNVAISGMTASGTVIASIAAGAAHDAANNGNTASTSTDNTVNYTMAMINNGGFESGSYNNLVLNGSFETSINWISEGGITYSLSNEQVKFDTLSGKFVSAGAGDIYQIISSPTSYRNKAVTFSAWIKCNTANAMQLAVRDDYNGTDYSPFVPGDSAWHFVTMTYNVSGSATYLEVCVKYMQSSGTGYVDGAEFVIDNPPNGWSKEGVNAVASPSLYNPYLGTYTAMLTRNGNNCHLYQDYVNYATLRGQTVTLGAWVYKNGNSVVDLALFDSAGGSNTIHSATPGWEWLAVTRTIDANTTFVQVRLRVGGDNGTGYFDGAALVLGSTITPTTN